MVALLNWEVVVPVFEILNTYYLEIKFLHIIFVIAWMVGLLYLPRLFVYHADPKINKQTSETFKIMEKRLLRIIINPAMFFVFLFGLILLFLPGHIDWSAGWIHAKLFFVLVLSGVHGFISKCQKDFFYNKNVKSSFYYKCLNEIPTVLLIIIVYLVVVKPF